MSKSTDEILIDHLDSILSGSESQEAAEMIRGDKELAKEWQSILFAVDAIREAGIREKVSSIHNQYQSQRSSASNIAGGKSLIRSLSRIAVRVAACLLLVIGAVAVYKYSTVNSSSVYEDHYTAFELNTSRSNNNQDEIEQLYRSKNWQAVINSFNQQSNKTNKSYFLAGMAQMELKNYSGAIESFSQVISNNAKTNDNYFQDEAEYYLALAFIASNQTVKALTLLSKIKADTSHLYNEQARNFSNIDLKILDFKSGK